jgi:hypothetical protein
VTEEATATSSLIQFRGRLNNTKQKTQSSIFAFGGGKSGRERERKKYDLEFFPSSSDEKKVRKNSIFTFTQFFHV